MSKKDRNLLKNQVLSQTTKTESFKRVGKHAQKLHMDLTGP